jgi:UPF0755 protein
VAVVLHLTYRPVVLNEAILVTIQPGEGTGKISERLDREGLLRSRRLFVWWARLRGIDRRLQPGRYEFAGPTAMSDVLEILYRGRAVTVTVTIPEGWTIAKMAQHLAGKLDFDSALFAGLSHDTKILRQWGIPSDNMEGYLLPETYLFFWGVKVAEVIERMAVANRTVFNDSALERMTELGWNRHEVLTLASMIEAETGSRVEHARISAVFHNRLRRRMLLQCRQLLRKDLEFESPYNTYLNPGLPPGPICNPGKASIFAALYPDSTNELYFVADRKGGHIFSATLREHNRARATLSRWRGRN